MRIRLILFLSLTILFWSALSHAFCFEEAAAENDVPAELLWAIAKVESGFDPQARYENSDGSFDIGVMQINSSWQSHFPPAIWSALDDPCTNVKTGATILADCLDRHGYSWKGIGCYNALSTAKRADYARRILSVMQQMPGADQFTSDR